MKTKMTKMELVMATTNPLKKLNTSTLSLIKRNQAIIKRSIMSKLLPQLKPKRLKQIRPPRKLRKPRRLKRRRLLRRLQTLHQSRECHLSRTLTSSMEE